MRNRSIFTAAALSLLLHCAAGAEEATKLPAEWLHETLSEKKTAGAVAEELFPDVIAVRDASGKSREYFLHLPEEDGKITRAEWLKKAAAGRSGPDARAPFRHLAKGYMLYAGRLGHKEGDAKLEDLRKEVFQAFRKQGVNTLVYLTYMPPADWPALRQTAEENDIDLIIQYNAAYYNPENRPDIWNNPERAQQKREQALAFLNEVFRDGNTKRFAGFSIREEPYLPHLSGMQEYHNALRERFPGVRIYTLYNFPNVMHATREPAPEIMGIDRYPFFGAILGNQGPYSKKPLFFPPQNALRTLAMRLKPAAEAALERGAVFTYTPALNGYTNRHEAAEAENRGWPTEGYTGIYTDPDGGVIYWRCYTPPPQALRASLWISAAYGALGWFPWTGNSQLAMPWLPPDKHYSEDHDNTGGDWSAGMPVYRGAIQTDQRANWKTYLETLEEIGALEPLLLKLRLDPQPRLESADPLLVAASHRISGENGDSRVLMLVNLDVGRWPGYPRADNREGHLTVTVDGKLAGFEPLTEPRAVEFTLRLKEGEIVRDVRTGELLKPREQIAPGRWHFVRAIEPGGAAVLFAGASEVFDRIAAPAAAKIRTTPAGHDDHSSIRTGEARASKESIKGQKISSFD